MSVEEALRDFLVNDEGVGGAVARRVHVNRQPQNDRQPSVLIRRVGTQDVRHLTGLTGEKDVRLQVECRAETAKAAIDLAKLVRAAGPEGGPRLEAYRGPMGDLFVRRALVEDERGLDVPPGHNDDRPVHVQELDLMILYSETPCSGGA